MFIENDINCFTLSRGDYFEYNININCGTKFEPKQYKLENENKFHQNSGLKCRSFIDVK